MLARELEQLENEGWGKFLGREDKENKFSHAALLYINLGSVAICLNSKTMLRDRYYTI